MDINFFLTNISTPAILIPAIIKEWKPYYQEEAFRNYEPEGHDVTKHDKRHDKQVYKPVFGSNPDDQGNFPHAWRTEPVARLALAIQKDIVKKAVAFLTGGKISLSLIGDPDAAETALYDAVSKTWSKNKLDFKNAPLARDVMHQLELAEVWYSEVNERKEVKMRVKFFTPDKGYKFYPVWDRGGDLIAFGMEYKVIDENGKELTYFDLWDNKMYHRYLLDSGVNWVYREDIGVDILGKPIPNPVPNVYGKIPVIYWTLPKAPYQDVQSLIDQLEKTMSNFCDTNEYNGSPILFTKGEIESLPGKGETGKAIKGLDPESEASYISIDSVPEMIKFETDFLSKNIYSLTDTPDISFEAMKGIGDVSGAAFDRIFMAAHVKAMEGHQGWYGEGMQRRINFLISACSRTQNITGAEDIEIQPVFSLFRLNGLADDVDLAMKANGGKPVMEWKQSIAFAGAVEDPEETYKQLKEEADNQAASRNTSQAASA